MSPEWDRIMRMYDESVLTLFVGVCAFALNWYVFTSPRARRIMTMVPLLATIIILALEILQGITR